MLSSNRKDYESQGKDVSTGPRIMHGLKWYTSTVLGISDVEFYVINLFFYREKVLLLLSQMQSGPFYFCGHFIIEIRSYQK